MIMFKIGSKNYSGNVVANNYNVSQNSVYKSWSDAFGVEHRSETRKRITGTFTMMFKTIEEYETFLLDLENNRDDDGTNEILIAINKPVNITKHINAFIEFETTRKLDGQWNDAIDSFKVTVKEK